VAAAPAVGGELGHSQSEHVRIELVADVQSIQPGKPFWAAVRFDIEKDWHLNWLNPGDAGLAPSITWKLPDGFEAGELLWPTPRRYQIGPLVIYGYDGELYLMARIAPPASLKPGTRAEISAEVDWLACAEACVPGRGEVHLTLPVRDSHPEPAQRWVAAIEKTRLDQPQPSSSWIVHGFIEDEERYELEARLVGDTGDPIEGAEFYPYASDVIEHAAVQQFVARRQGFDLVLKRARMSLEFPDRLTGVLVILPAPRQDRKRVALTIDVPLERR
jgi:DsbC/DsbD-like thiol-disulfide interchange protein